MQLFFSCCMWLFRSTLSPLQDGIVFIVSFVRWLQCHQHHSFFFLFFHTNNVRETYCVWCLGSGGFFQCSVLLSLHCITHYCFAMKSRRIMASSFMKDTSSMFSDTFGMVQIFLIWCRTSSLSMGCDQWSSPIQTSKCTGVRAFSLK